MVYTTTADMGRSPASRPALRPVTLDFMAKLRVPPLPEQPSLDFQDKCAVAGAIISDRTASRIGRNPNFAVQIVYQFMLGLQHRGDAAAGYSYQKANGALGCRRWKGEVSRCKPSSLRDRRYKSRIAAGHDRYCTSGSAEDVQNAMPLTRTVRINGKIIDFSLSHNGNITNDKELKNWLRTHNKKIKGNSDSAMVATLMAHVSRMHDFKTEAELVHTVCQALQGSYCFEFQFKDCIVAARDPNGNRPFHFATDTLGSYFMFSETCAAKNAKLKGFDPNSLWFGEIKPGEIITFRADCSPDVFANSSKRPKKSAFCSIEDIYMARAESAVSNCAKKGAQFIVMSGRRLYRLKDLRTYRELRKLLGHSLADQHSKVLKESCAIIAVPNSGKPYAEGIAEKLNIPTSSLLFNRHSKRSFQGTSTLEQETIAATKYLLVKELLDQLLEDNNGSLEGKTLTFVDDSIIRGTTLEALAPIFKYLKEKHGVAKIIFVSAYPTVEHHCPYGIAISTKGKLFVREVITKMMSDPNHIKNAYGIDSILYMDQDEMAKTKKKFIQESDNTEDDLNDKQEPGQCFGCVDQNYKPSVFDLLRRGVTWLENSLVKLNNTHN